MGLPCPLETQFREEGVWIADNQGAIRIVWERLVLPFNLERDWIGDLLRSLRHWEDRGFLREDC